MFNTRCSRKSSFKLCGSINFESQDIELHTFYWLINNFYHSYSKCRSCLSFLQWMTTFLSKKISDFNSKSTSLIIKCQVWIISIFHGCFVKINEHFGWMLLKLLLSSKMYTVGYPDLTIQWCVLLRIVRSIQGKLQMIRFWRGSKVPRQQVLRFL